MPQVQKRSQTAHAAEGPAGVAHDVMDHLKAALEGLEDLRGPLADPADASVMTSAQWANLQGKLMALTSTVREINAARAAHPRT